MKRKIEAPYGDVVSVPHFYWDDLAAKNMDEVCKKGLCASYEKSGFILDVLNYKILVDFKERGLSVFENKNRKRINEPFLELIALVYLLNVSEHGITGKMISVKDLKTAHFFQGPHELSTKKILKRFGYDVQGFIKAAEKIGGKKINQADAGFTFYVFPKIPVHYLLWQGDEEFSPHISVLFDESIEHHLAADGIWGMVSIVTDAVAGKFFL